MNGVIEELIKISYFKCINYFSVTMLKDYD